MTLLSLTSLLVGLGTAHAETARVLPDGSAVVYAGLGLTTFRKLRYGDGQTLNASGQVIGDATLDRHSKPRLDLYGSLGLTRWLQVSAWLPVVASFATTDDSTGPCPNQGPDGFCDSVVGVGEAGVQARLGVLRGDLSLAPSLAVTSDIWNAGSRGQFTSIGDASVSVVPGLYLGYERGLGDWTVGVVGSANYGWNVVRRQIDFGSAAPFWAPGDELAETVELKVGLPAPLELSGALEGVQRLSGQDWEGSYYQDYWIDNDDRWSVLRYQHVAVRTKLSVSLPDNMGLHLQAGKVVDVRNGPPDSWDFGIGWHKYFAPRSG